MHLNTAKYPTEAASLLGLHPPAVKTSVTMKIVKSSFSVLITCKILILKHMGNIISLVPEFHSLIGHLL